MEIFQKLADLLNQFKTNMGTVVGPLAILAVAFCAIKIIAADNERSVDSAKRWLIAIIVGVILFYLAEPLINTFAGLAE